MPVAMDGVGLTLLLPGRAAGVESLEDPRVGGSGLEGVKRSECATGVVLRVGPLLMGDFCSLLLLSLV